MKRNRIWKAIWLFGGFVGGIALVVACETGRHAFDRGEGGILDSGLFDSGFLDAGRDANASEVPCTHWEVVGIPGGWLQPTGETVDVGGSCVGSNCDYDVNDVPAGWEPYADSLFRRCTD